MQVFSYGNDAGRRTRILVISSPTITTWLSLFIMLSRFVIRSGDMVNNDLRPREQNGPYDEESITHLPLSQGECESRLHLLHPLLQSPLFTRQTETPLT